MKIGIDIVEIERISKLIKNERFIERVFTKEEIAYCRKKKRQSQHFAVRFATKEAVWKAIGHNNISHKDISVNNLDSGKPRVTIKGKNYKNIDISLSHADHYAVAVAVVL